MPEPTPSQIPTAAEPDRPVGGDQGRGPTHRRRARVDRRPVLAVVAAVGIVGVVFGSAGGHGGPAVAPAGIGPEVAPADALTSTWFCAGATDTATGPAPGRLVVTNAGRAAVSGTVRLVPSSGSPVSVAIAVPPLDRIVVPETVPGGSAWIGSVVDLAGGDVSVEQQVDSPLGTTAEPCATAGSSTWYFASGATLVNASSTVSLLNPYASPAIANFTFTTNEGVETPGADQGVVVPPGGLVAVDLGAHLRRRTAIATTVSVTAGRLVAWRTDVVSPPAAGTPLLGTKAAAAANADPASPYTGVTETLGAPATSTRWYWPEGGTSAGVSDTYRIYNPGPGTARLSLAISLDQGSAEPYTLQVGPDEVVAVTPGGTARVPVGSGYSAVLRSTDGVGVVAERVVEAGRPSSLRGTGSLLGATATATRWLIGAGRTSSRLEEAIVVSNPGPTAARVSLVALSGGHEAPVGDLLPSVVPAGGRLVWDLGTHEAGLASAIEVRSTTPVVVGRDLIGLRSQPGVGLALGVPAP